VAKDREAKETPRGGVDAGEQPAGTATGGSNAVTLGGTAAGLALLAGTVTLMVRRRTNG
jgi:hypothetical protein